MIPDDEVERVRESAEIVSVIGEYVNLRRTGTDWRGPCPFHQGTHRNFSVSPKKKIYYCFVCHAGGDVFQFLQQRVGVDWPEAVRMVARRSGIELREVHSRQREGPDPREPLWEANAAALEYFTRMLHDDALGAPARQYLESRAVSREVADRFALGFAPREIGLMRSYLTTLGIDDATQLEVGLLARREEGDEPRPRFRGRLVFPIHDTSGKAVGFGGRLIGPGEPKYLNSGESPIYSKGKLLYNLYQAKNAIRREDRLIVVEGYFDVLRLVAAGVDTVVAPLGTALTSEQAELIAHYTKRVYLLYDSDKAGRKATFRAGDALLAKGIAVRAVVLPEGEDPDSFVLKYGRQGVEHAIAKSIDVFGLKLEFLRNGGWFGDDLQKRRAAVDRLLPTIRATADPVLRDIYIEQASEWSRVNRAVLEAEVAGKESALPGNVRRNDTQPSQARNVSSTGAVSRGEGPRSIAQTPHVKAQSAERALLASMLRSSLAIEWVRESLDESDFLVPLHRVIFSAMKAAQDAGELESVAARLSAAAAELLEQIADSLDPTQNLDRTVEQSILRLEQRRIEQRNQMIDGMIRLASDTQKNELAIEKMLNQKQIGEMHAVRFNQ